MKTIWYAIDPTLTKEGAFASFSLFSNAKELKPVPLGEDEHPYDGADFTIESKFLSNKIEANISYGSFFSGKLDSSNRLFMYDFSYHKTVIVDNPIGGLISGTRYGSALRIGVYMKNVNIDISANFAAIAAAVALGKGEASYKIEGIGIGDALGIIAPELPVSGNFDFETFGKIASVGQKLVQWIPNNKSKLGVSPIQVGLVTPFEDISTDTSQAMFFAMKYISKGIILSKALKAKPLHLKDDVIKNTYEYITKQDNPDYAINESEKELALKWLDFKDI